MDPDAAIRRLLDAAADGDADEVRDAADDVVGWLNKGGFPPSPRSCGGR